METQPAAQFVDRAYACPCFKCAYDLRGLQLDGKCPECGELVAHSLRGTLLQFADKEYIAQITSGVSLVLNAILLMVIAMVLGVAASAIGAASGVAPGSIQLVVSVMTFGIAIMSCVGYFKFATPDPGFTGTEYPDTARKIIRFVVVLQIAIAVIQFVTGMLSMAAIGSGAGGFGSILILGALVLGLGSLVAWVVLIISVMNYLHWLAKRIPDAHIERRSKMYRWLLPVIYVVGALVVIGPLIALVMYWNLLDRLRKHLKSIQSVGVPATLKGTHLG